MGIVIYVTCLYLVLSSLGFDSELTFSKCYMIRDFEGVEVLAANT